jgi:RNA polymerase-interacting CarD/CdnL/TRCF family regulator
MGAIHVTPADQTLFITAIGAMATVVTVLWKRQNDKDEANKAEMKELLSEVKRDLKESNQKCEENVLLRKELFTLKEEIGYLKGIFKSFKQDTNPKTTKGKDEKA